MIATRNDALSTGLANRRLVEFTIVILAVGSAAATVVEPGFLALVLLIPLAITALLSLDWFIYATVFLLPWYPYIDWKLPLRDAFLLGRFVLFASVCLLLYREGVSFRSWLWEGRLRKGLIAFAAFAAFTVFVSELRASVDPYKALFKLFSYTALFFAILGWARTGEKITRLLEIILISTIGLALFGFYQSWSGGYTEVFFRLYPDMEEVMVGANSWSGRIVSFLFHFNSLAGYLCAVVPFALGALVLPGRPLMRGLGFVCLAFTEAALYLTGSRGGLIACAAVMLLCLWYLRPRGGRLVAILASGILAVALVAGLSSAGGGERLQTVDEFTQVSRLAIWGVAGMNFLQHPILGIGFGTFRIGVSQLIPGLGNVDAHNIYLQTLAETGIIGFIIFFTTMWWFFRISVSLIKSADTLSRMVGIGVAGALAATMVHGMVDYIFIASPQFGNLFWLLLALALATHELRRKESVGGLKVSPGIGRSMPPAHDAQGCGNAK